MRARLLVAAAVVATVGLTSWVATDRLGGSFLPAANRVQRAAGAATGAGDGPANDVDGRPGTGAAPRAAGATPADDGAAELAIAHRCGAGRADAAATEESATGQRAPAETAADEAPTDEAPTDGAPTDGADAAEVPINLEGDLGSETRDYYAALAAEHDGERPDEPVVLHWAAETAGSPTVDLEEVACVAAAAYDDPRGWNLGGAIRFERVDTAEEADFVLVVAEAEVVPEFSDSCLSGLTGRPDASCTVGNYVIINDERWRDGALGDPIPLEQFRIHELNHETGHWLGQGHFSCLGGVAAVNQQQFRSLQGCTPNAWPLPFERAMVAARFGLWPSIGASEPYAEFGWDGGWDGGTSSDTGTGWDAGPADGTDGIGGAGIAGGGATDTGDRPLVGLGIVAATG